MHPSISFFPNSSFYDNLILDAPNVRKKSYEKHYLPGAMFGPYSFVNVNDGREEKDEDGHSRKNMVEVAIVLKLLQNLYKGTCVRLETHLSIFKFWFPNGFFLCALFKVFHYLVNIYRYSLRTMFLCEIVVVYKYLSNGWAVYIRFNPFP